MAVNTTNVTSASNYLPTIWDTESGDAVQANIVLSELVDTSFDQKMRVGNILKIIDKSNPAVRMKSTDTTGTWANIVETSQSITVNKHAYVAFLVEDIAEIEAQNDLRADYTNKAGYSLAAFMEGDGTSGIVSLFSGFTNLTGALGVDPTDDDLIRTVQYLDDNDVPEDGRAFYVTPSVHAALLKMDKFTRQEYVGQDAAETAVLRSMVGKAYNAPVYKSSLAKNSSATAGQSYSWFGHQRGIALIRQQMPTTHTQYIILETGWGVLINLIYQFASRNIAPKTLGGGVSSDFHNVGVRGA